MQAFDGVGGVNDFSDFLQIVTSRALTCPYFPFRVVNLKAIEITQKPDLLTPELLPSPSDELRLCASDALRKQIFSTLVPSRQAAFPMNSDDAHFGGDTNAQM